MNQNTRYINEHEASAITGRAVKTLRNDRSKKIGLPYVKIGASVRYSLTDIYEFMERNKIRTYSC